MSAKQEATDALQRFTFDGLPIRGQWIRLSKVIEDAHGGSMAGSTTYPAAVSELLAQMLAAVAMLADNLKFDGSVALQSRGHGALLRSLAECRGHSSLRGIAHLNEDVTPPQNTTNLTDWLVDGQLALSLVPSTNSSDQTTYQGFVELEHPTLAQNLEVYFERSEQLLTDIKLAYDPQSRSVTGLLLQRLPDADLAGEVTISESEDAWQTLQTLANSITDQELLQLPASQMLNRLFHQYPCRLYPARELRYECTCSRAKSDRTLKTLSAQELDELIAEIGSIKVDCEFCGNQYVYDSVDISQLNHGTESTPDDEGTLH